MQTIHFQTIDTPLGKMLACATDEGICSLNFIDEQDKQQVQSEMESLSSMLNMATVNESNLHIDNLQRQLEEYFKGTRQKFELNLILCGTEFQKSVWNLLLTVPYGVTKSYREQAETFGNPAAIRAVASANGSNRIAILVPCHRIIGSKGQLTGYRGGLWRKQYLLDMEAKYSNKSFQQELLR
jgi:AraC family transcriptional regulator of adaptative response/methylated-DNA-[protein]-cysteine methyltransferase